MIITKRSRSILLVSQLLLLTSLPMQADANQPAEEPPPWAARQDVSPTPLPTQTAPLPAASRQTVGSQGNGSNSMESWYRARQSYVAKPAASVDALQAQAQQGDMKAQYALALLLRQQGGDIQQSIDWQEKAAQAGHVEAQYGLGVLYANGQYVQVDQRLSAFWYKQAAQRGHQAAKLALANSPAEPVGMAQAPAAPVPQARPQRAQPVAPAQRPARVQPALAEPVPVVSATPAWEEVALASPAAPPVTAPAAPVAVVPEPAELASVGAAGAAGLEEEATAADALTEEAGISVEHNKSKVDLGGMTVTQVMEAAYKGDMYAQLMLGALYEDGSDDGVEQSFTEAATWYLKAARQGYPKAQHNLALLYEDGRGLEQSYEQAAIWYAKAAKAGFSEAQNNLAVLYILGNGVGADRAKAEQLLTAAVAQGNENARRNLQKLLEGAAG